MMCDAYDYPINTVNGNINLKNANRDENGCIKCKKCDEMGFVLLQRKDVYCRDCFGEYCAHKFRATIGKSKLVRSGDRVLIAFSAGLSSAAIVDMIRDGLSETQHKKLRFVPSLVHIDESVITDDSLETRQLCLNEIADIMLETGFRCLMSSIETTFRSLDDHNFYVDLGKQSCIDLLSFNSKQFLNSFQSIKSITSKEEFVKRMRYRLICDIAVKENYDKVFLASNGSRLSVQIITDIAIGKGIQLQSESGFVDYRHAIPILRPLREFTAKEIAFYTVMQKCKHKAKPSLTTHLNNKASIAKMTEHFINGLENDFPATVYTIFKTANKLQSSDTEVDDQKCIVCNTRIDITDRVECSAQQALQLTSMLSKNLNFDGELTDSTLSSNYCYGCNIIANEMTGVDHKFPVMCRENKSVQRDDIIEFLIDDSEDEVMGT